MTISLPGALRRIYDMLKEKKMTIEEIASAAGIKRDTAKKYLRELIKRGLVLSDGTHFWVKEEVKPAEAKPVEEKKEEIEVKPAEVKPVEEKAPPEAKPHVEEVKKEEKPEVKPKVVDRFVDKAKAFYFYTGFNEPVLLSVRSLKQLLIAIEYEFIDTETLSSSVKSGCIQEWLKKVFAADDLATKIDELKDLPPSALRVKLLELLKEALAS